MQEYHFTLQYDNYEAKLVLGGNGSLYELAEFLIKTVGFDFDHAFQFCNNLKTPYQSSECYSLFADMGDGDGESGSRKPGLPMSSNQGREWFSISIMVMTGSS